LELKKQKKVGLSNKINFKNLFINIGLYALSVVLLFVLLNWVLRWYTMHDKSLTVPDFKNMTIDEVQSVMADKDLTFEIKDSVYTADKPPMTVVDQNPKAGFKVKPGRRIYLVLNTDKAPMIALPQLQSVPLRQAERILSSYGIRIDSTRYIPDIAENAVLSVEFNGKEVEAGFKLPKGSGIVLILGDGGKSGPVEVPSLLGKSLDEAKFILAGNSLNLGAVITNPDVSDSLSAIIFKQRPLAGEKISKGSAIDIFLRNQ
jgi:beta-lactam-binding protein with PASTA domain